MKPVWTIGKKSKNKHSLRNIKLNCDNNELTIVSSLSILKNLKDLNIFDGLSSSDFADNVGSYGDCHILDQVNLREGNIYLLNNDQDGFSPNIEKVTSKLKTNKEISFFINSSNKSTSDFIDEAISGGASNILVDYYLVFRCVPQNEDISKKFSSNINLFIQDRIKKKKLMKFKIPNGIYGVYEVVFVPILFKSISEISEPGELLGCYIGK